MIATRVPSSEYAEGALQHLDQACQLFKKAAPQSRPAEKGLVRFVAACDSWFTVDDRSQTVLQWLQRNAHYVRTMLPNTKSSPDQDVMDDELVTFGGCTQSLKGSSQNPPAMQSISTPQLLQTPPHAVQVDVATNTNNLSNEGYAEQHENLDDDQVLQKVLLPPQRTSPSTTLTSSSLHAWTPPPPPPPFVPSAHLQLLDQNQSQPQHLHQPHSHLPHPLSFQRSLPLQGHTHMNLSNEVILPSTLPLPPQSQLPYQANGQDPDPSLSCSSSFGAYDATWTPIHHHHTFHGTFPMAREYPEIGPVSENSGLSQRWMSYPQDSGVFHGWDAPPTS